ncbi:MAG: hypothetical protein B7X31_14850 [Thiomonas sp. 13-66-29]|nr:MAG: hypothetical protein B7X46_03890 [Thiomonas sp. 15-66-11]OZB57674.1 MAG: hypothetical protein B7X31_14850 [Thiomonas sp. 13-66-29]
MGDEVRAELDRKLRHRDQVPALGEQCRRQVGRFAEHEIEALAAGAMVRGRSGVASFPDDFAARGVADQIGKALRRGADFDGAFLHQAVFDAQGQIGAGGRSHCGAWLGRQGEDRHEQQAKGMQRGGAAVQDIPFQSHGEHDVFHSSGGF